MLSHLQHQNRQVQYDNAEHPIFPILSDISVTYTRIGRFHLGVFANLFLFLNVLNDKQRIAIISMIYPNA